MIDASIPLQANPQYPDVMKLSELGQMVQKQKSQNALKQILAAPGAIDPATGLPSEQAIAQVSKVDPQAGIKMALTSAELKQRLQEGKTEEWKAYAPLLKDTKDSLANILQPDIEKFGLEKAVQMHRSDYADALKNLTKQGLPANLLGAMPPELNAQVASALVAQAVSPEKKADLAEKKAAGERADKKETEAERHNRAVEERLATAAGTKADAAAQKGWQEYVDKAGTTYRDNVGAGLTQKKVDGKWVDVDQLPADVRKPGTQEKKDFTPKMGDLMAALAEKGVALPTGFRSKEQQMALYQGVLDRNPSLSADDIAQKIKLGEIEFGAQKKETQTAAGIAGRVEVAGHEIKKFVPLAREASKRVPRGKWVSGNKLMQMGAKELSDPDLKELKSYITTTLNAYDLLAARGGTDKDKREENRQLLLSADGPEAFERALNVMEKESQVALEAAVEATKVPELEDTRKKPADTSLPTGWSVKVK